MWGCCLLRLASLNSSAPCDHMTSVYGDKRVCGIWAWCGIRHGGPCGAAAALIP